MVIRSAPRGGVTWFWRLFGYPKKGSWRKAYICGGCLIEVSKRAARMADGVCPDCGAMGEGSEMDLLPRMVAQTEWTSPGRKEAARKYMPKDGGNAG